jgi:hypothetical protein
MKKAGELRETTLRDDTVARGYLLSDIQRTSPTKSIAQLHRISDPAILFVPPCTQRRMEIAVLAMIKTLTKDIHFDIPMLRISSRQEREINSSK